MSLGWNNDAFVFGNLTPIFWSLILVAGLLGVTLFGIICFACYYREKRKLLQRRFRHPTPNAPYVDDVEIPASLLRPPSSNPQYLPNQRPSPRMTPGHRYHTPPTIVSPSHEAFSSSDRLLVANCNPPPYDEGLYVASERVRQSAKTHGGSTFEPCVPIPDASD